MTGFAFSFCNFVLLGFLFICLAIYVDEWVYRLNIRLTPSVVVLGPRGEDPQNPKQLLAQKPKTFLDSGIKCDVTLQELSFSFIDLDLGITRFLPT